MAKGGGRPKGRPRKVLVMTPPKVIDPVSTQGAESSRAAEARVSSVINGGGESIGVDSLKKIELEIKASMDKQSEYEKIEQEKEEKAKEIEDGGAQPLRRKGMNLSYVAPVLIQGKPTAQLRLDEIESEIAKWKYAVILYVIGESPTISYLKNYLRIQCKVENAEIYYHNDDYFVVKCEARTDQERLLFEGPYMIASIPVIIKEWRTDFKLEDEVLKEVPLWVRLPNLPLHCWSGDSLSRIGSVLGTPLCVDECTTQQSRISYARVLVEVDITKPLTYKIPITGKYGVELSQQVYYEWVPIFCPKCQKLGHICKEKKENSLPVPQQKQWVPKEKGKEKEVSREPEKQEEEWKSPKHAALASIQVGHIHIPTENVFYELNNTLEGGDLFPKGVP